MRYVLSFMILMIFPSICIALAPSDINCNEPDTFCANSCAIEDIQTSVDEALDSTYDDVTVYIPSCSSTPYTWTDGSKINVDTKGSGKFLRIIGSGEDTTHIVHFQLDYPNTRRANLVELGHITCDGGETTSQISDTRFMVPELNSTELFFHDLTIKAYDANYTMTLGMVGVASNITMYCKDYGNHQNAYGITVYGDGSYSDHKDDLGTRNAFFIEDSTFYDCSHTISEFCDGFLVFRNNNVVNSDSYLDIHGPGYNYCPFCEGETDHGGGGFEVWQYAGYNSYMGHSSSRW